MCCAMCHSPATLILKVLLVLYLDICHTLVCNSCTLTKVNSASVVTELDPNNYMIFYRRATVYLAMGKSKSALPDLDVVLSLKPDFNAVCILLCVFSSLYGSNER